MFRKPPGQQLNRISYPNNLVIGNIYDKLHDIIFSCVDQAVS